MRPEGDALARYGANMVPVGLLSRHRRSRHGSSSTRTNAREPRWTAIASGTPDPHFGFKQSFVNPATGASPMPTIGAFAQRLPAGFDTQPYRSTDGTVYVCLEGEGEAAIGDQSLGFAENDVFVVPSWHTLRLHAGRDTLLFSYFRRPVQQALGLWREQRL